MVAPMSLKTFGFSAVARALAATAVLGFGMAAAPAAYASVQSETDALAAAIEAALNNSAGKTAVQIRKEIAALIADPAYQNADVQVAFTAAKAAARPKIDSAFTGSYYDQAYLAVTEIGKSINFALSQPTGAGGGSGSTGGAAISNTTIGGAVAAGGHS